MSARQGGNKYKHDSSDPYHEFSPVDNPEAPNDFPDCPAKDLLGDEGNDVEGAAVGPGRDGNVDGARQAKENAWTEDCNGGGWYKAVYSDSQNCSSVLNI